MTEDAELAKAGAYLSPVLVEPVSVSSVPPIAAQMVKADILSARPVLGQRAVYLVGVRTRSTRKRDERLVSEPASVTETVPVRERVWPETATLAPVRSSFAPSGGPVCSVQSSGVYNHAVHRNLFGVTMSRNCNLFRCCFNDARGAFNDRC